MPLPHGERDQLDRRLRDRDRDEARLERMRELNEKAIRRGEEARRILERA